MEPKYASFAALARQLGVSRARVTQVLRLLQLDPEVIETIATLGDPWDRRIVSERYLRAVLLLPGGEQRKKVQVLLKSKLV